jgi:hypothetical protein
MKTLTVLALFTILAAATAPAATPDNDATCDIKVGPAATLLLPYFEIDLDNAAGRTTLFTITNVSRYSQIAHVTLWTDYAVPVFNFNIFLTGYDVQAINLRDILTSGIVGSQAGTGPTTVKSPLGTAGSAFSMTAPANGGPGYTNPNFQASINCDANPGVIAPGLIAFIRKELTIGASPNCSFVGGTHRFAIGYATIDVVGACTDRFPSDPLYYTADLLFDNVLIGDYQQIGAQPAGAVTASFDASANPMVHLRAVPEGGSAGSNAPVALPYTFYDRYTPPANRPVDRRQPLPSTFAARFIQGGPARFATNFTIWREGFGTGTGACGTFIANAVIPIAELVRFDERENPFVSPLDCGDPCIAGQYTLPVTSSTSTAGATYPFLAGSDVGGWMYLNLNNGGSTSYSVTSDITGVPAVTNLPGRLAPAGATTTKGPRPSQNWVTITMFGKLGTNDLAGEFDAASLGNGCSPAAFNAILNRGNTPIGPAGGVFVCPPGTSLANGTTDLCTGTNINPKP